MRNYELMVIISPDVSEEDIPGTIDKVSDFITSRGGTITEVAHWGKRKLAYPIARFREGDYVLSRFKFKPEMAAELEANLKISEMILRHLLVRLGD